MTQKQLGQKIGISAANVSAWENGLHDPGYAQVVAISQLSGEPMPLESNVTHIAGGTHYVPLLNNVHAGKWADVIQGRSVDDISELIPATGKARPGCFAMRVEGNCMQPLFPEGFIIIVDPSAAYKPGDYVVAINGNEEWLFRQYKLHKTTKEGKEIFKLVPLNDAHPIIYSDEHEGIKIAGKVVQFIGELP